MVGIVWCLLPKGNQTRLLSRCQRTSLEIMTLIKRDVFWRVRLWWSHVTQQQQQPGSALGRVTQLGAFDSVTINTSDAVLGLYWKELFGDVANGVGVLTLSYAMYLEWWGICICIYSWTWNLTLYCHPKHSVCWQAVLCVTGTLIHVRCSGRHSDWGS